MDELQFRRQAYSDPNCQDKEFQQTLKDDVNLQEFVTELKTLDGNIEDALNVEVPSTLFDKLMHKPHELRHNNTKKRSRIMLSLAASVALVIGLGFTVLRLAPVNMAENSLAHVYAEEDAFSAVDNISYETINAKLASIDVLPKVSFTKQPGRVTYTTYCDFQGVRGLHMVLEGKQDNVAVFIFPDESRMQIQQTFADGSYQGEAFKQGDAYLILVGKEQQDIEFVKKEVQDTLI